MSAHRWSRIVCVLGIVWMTGCGRSTNQLCEDFVNECGSQNSVADCEGRAGALEQEATDKQCLQLWDAYVGCVDDLKSLCNTAQDCAAPRNDLATFCGIHFE